MRVAFVVEGESMTTVECMCTRCGATATIDKELVSYWSKAHLAPTIIGMTVRAEGMEPEHWRLRPDDMPQLVQVGRG